MKGCNFMHHHHHHHRGEGLWPFRGWITPSRVGWVKVKWPAPPLHDPRRQCTLPRLCSLPSYIPRSPAFRGSRERGEGEKSCITLQGKISETKVGLSVCWGAANNGSFLSERDFKGWLSDCSELYFVVDHWGNSQMFSHTRHHYGGSSTQ